MFAVNTGHFILFVSYLNDKAWPRMRIFAFVYHRNFIDRNIRNLAILVAQIQDAAFYIDDIAAKCGVGPARNVNLFAK